MFPMTVALCPCVVRAGLTRYTSKPQSLRVQSRTLSTLSLMSSHLYVQRRSVAPESISFTQSLSPHPPASSIPSEGSVTGGHSTHHKEREAQVGLFRGVRINHWLIQCRSVTTNVLSDDASWKYFVFPERSTWSWKKLAGVCQQWRHIIVASPRVLDLRLACHDRISIRTSGHRSPSL